MQTIEVSHAVPARARLSLEPERLVQLAYVPKHDLYGPVHKGLRWALSDMLTRLGSADLSDAASMVRMLDDLEGVLYVFSMHAAHEDAHLHRAIEARHAGGSARMAASHDEQEQMIAELRALICAFINADSSSRAGLFRGLYLRFASFAAENFAHMSEEETYAQVLLDRLYSYEELAVIHHELLAGIGPDEMLAAMRLMLIAASPKERDHLLANAAAGAPPVFVAQLLSSVRAQLPEHEHARLSRLCAKA
jgi:hypothetical protein